MKNNQMQIDDFKIGDIVKHIDQDIWGTVLHIDYNCNDIVINDLDSEYEYPDSELIYRPYELKLSNQIKQER